MLRALLVLLLAQSAVAYADSSVTVELTPEAENLARRLGISVPELVERAHTKIEELYKLARLDSLLNAFADTGSFAQRTAGVDYDPDPGDILVGLAVVGAHADVAIGTTNEWLGGSIVNVVAMAGVNLGRWQHPRWTVFANGFYQGTTIRGLQGNLLTLGTHAQYRILPGRRTNRVYWTGVAATVGLEYARWTVGESTDGPIDSHFTAEGAEGATVERYTIHMSSTGTLDVVSNTLTVPIELTTGVRVVDYVALYAGGGLDLTAGSSEIVADLDSVLSYTGERIEVGTAHITASGENGPSTVAVHALGGVALHTRHVRAFAQGALSPGVLGVSLGVRAAF